MLDTIKLVSAVESLFGGLSMPGAANLRLLAGMLEADSRMTDLRWKAYALATVHRECGADFQTRAEIGKPAYFDRYAPGTPMGKALGNIQDGDGLRFRGRGYVQITGRRNYANFSHLLDVDLVNDPDLALDPKYAYQILSLGMTQGLFTGVGLGRFIAAARCDYLHARRIINGMDHAEEIAAAAAKFEQAWREASA